MATHMLTTVDNPYDPTTHFDEWYAFDESHGYFTMNLLARVLVTSDELSDADQDAAVEDAIDDVISNNVSGLFRKVEVKTSET